MTSDSAIDLQHIVKTYRKRVHALNDVAMNVRRGEIFGLLGPNGAGKSTLVKIMMTVVRPTHAEGMVLGQPVGDKPTLARVGYLPENHRFPRYLTGRQTIEFFGALAKVSRADLRRRSGELLDVVGMSARADSKVSTYSKGMMQRIGIAQALINNPDLIVLDEPTDGVDPLGRREIRDVMLQLRERGKTVFINSHQLSELEMICDRVAILVGGRVARHGTVDALTREQQRYEIELALPDPAAARLGLCDLLGRLGAPMAEKRPSGSIPLPGDGAGTLPPPLPTAPMFPAPPGSTWARFALDGGQFPQGPWVELEGAWIRIGSADPAAIQPIIDALRQGGFTVARVIPIRQSLEDLFMQAIVAQSGQARRGDQR